MVAEKKERAISRRKGCCSKLIDKLTRDKQNPSYVDEVDRLRMLFLYLQEHEQQHIKNYVTMQCMEYTDINLLYYAGNIFEDSFLIPFESMPNSHQ